MNRHTFKDVVGRKRSALANELENDDDDDREVNAMRSAVEGEEEESGEKFNEAGEVMEPFNLKDERDRGHFDENMNFVFKKERGEIDAWLATMDEATMEKSIGEAAEAMKRKQEEDNKATSSEYNNWSVLHLKRKLLKIVQPGEIVTQALKRLGAQNTPKNFRRSKSAKSDQASNGGLANNNLQLTQLIECADALLTKGVLGIYESTFESLENSLYLWQYRALDGSFQGPFTSQQIAAWKAQGFFTGESAVFMRRCGLEDDPSVAITTGKRKANSETKIIYNDRDNSIQSVAKKGRIDVGEEGTYQADLLADLDEYNVEDTTGEEVISSKNHSSSDLSASHNAFGLVSVIDESWILSDDLDFGEYSSAYVIASSDSAFGLTGDKLSSKERERSEGGGTGMDRVRQRGDSMNQGDHEIDIDVGNDEEDRENERTGRKRKVRFQLKSTAAPGEESDSDKE